MVALPPACGGRIRDDVAFGSPAPPKLFLNQRGLAGRAQPAAAFLYPNVSESSVVGIRLPLGCSLLFISAGHNYRVFVNPVKHGSASDAGNVLGTISNTDEKLGLVPHAPINVNKNE